MTSAYAIDVSNPDNSWDSYYYLQFIFHCYWDTVQHCQKFEDFVHILAMQKCKNQYFIKKYGFNSNQSRTLKNTTVFNEKFYILNAHNLITRVAVLLSINVLSLMISYEIRQLIDTPSINVIQNDFTRSRSLGLNKYR